MRINFNFYSDKKIEKQSFADKIGNIIQNEKNIESVHIIKFNRDFFNGKKVLLFDDIITRGFSYARFACEIENFGAEVLGGYFLGRTLLK